MSDEIVGGIPEGLDALFLMRGAGNVIAERAAGTLFAGTASARRQ